MSVLGRIASGLPKVVCSALPTAVDACLGITLINTLSPKPVKEARWIWGVSTLGGIVIAGFLRGSAYMSKIPAGLIYVSWKAYQVYLYRKTCESETNEFFDTLRQGTDESIKTYFTKTPQLFRGTNKQGKNALHIFAERGSENLVKWILLVEKDLNLNVAISQEGALNGWKPLH